MPDREALRYESADEAILGLLHLMGRADQGSDAFVQATLRAGELARSAGLDRDATVKRMKAMRELGADRSDDDVIAAAAAAIPPKLRAAAFAHAVEAAIGDHDVAEREKAILQKLGKAFALPREIAQKLIDVMLIRSAWPPKPPRKASP